MSLSSTINARPLAAPPSMTAAPPTHRPNSIRIPSSTVSSSVPPSLVTPSPSESAETKLNMCGTKEKVGRWSENEHDVFLEGLKIYGKQWKTIASMIGTRSVVQVRTHAQKYFQKMERKNQGVQLANTTTTKPAKRKSLPSSSSNLRKKAKKPSSMGNRVASSPTLVPAVTLDAVLPASVPELPSFPSYVSSSSFSTNSDTWSSSPTSVATDTIDLFPDNTKAVTALDTFEMIGDDPLEWLLETGTHILPESSLPVFPDLEEPLATTTVDMAISNMVDASVTMKSLILPSSDES